MAATECPKCGYARQPSDTAPDYECPSCGVVYAKFDPRAHTARLALAKQKQVARQKQKVAIVGTLVLVIVIAAGAFAYVENINEAKRQAELAATRAEFEKREREEERKQRIAAARAETANRMAAYNANPENFRTSAMVWCESAIKRLLDDPDSANFDSVYDDIPLAGLLGSQWSVKRRLRAKNRFGAFERQMWGCTVDVSGGEARVVSARRLQ
jgi:predicted  nucleic acid-binding Zn-ribbon protein